MRIVVAAPTQGAELPGDDLVRCGTPAEVAALARTGKTAWLRGCEAVDSGTDWTALILARAAARHRVPWIVEGLGPRAAAACIAAGANGIVLGPELWLCEGSPISAAHQRALTEASSGRDTERVGGNRFLARGKRGVFAAPQNVGFLGPAGRSTADVVSSWREAVETHLELIGPELAHSDPFSAGTSLVQGPMANVTERADFAHRVRAAGAMPFAALGALDPEQAEAVLAAFAEVHPPWGVGLIGFDVMPHRAAHLALLERARAAGRGPSAVLLAGGSPELARSLQDRGFDAWLHAPTGRLAEQALSAGARGFVFEGHEAGGHVGALTSLGLWEEGLAATENAAHATVVLAGGIGCATSAAIAVGMAARAKRAGVRVALQVGSAWMATHELVETRQITPLYQQVALAADQTTLVGATVNLPLRVAPNAWTRQAQAMEHRLAADGVDRDERRRRIEHANLGRTRLAAKGIERDPHFGTVPGVGRYRSVPVARQLEEGAFTFGQGAAVTPTPLRLADLVAALTTGAAAVLGAPAARPTEPRTVAGSPPAVHRERPTAEPIAIVGFGCVLPGCANADVFWQRLLAGFDAIDAVPPDRWSAERYFHPAAEVRQGFPALSTSHLAGSVGNPPFDPLHFRIPPRVLPSLDRSQRLALLAADEAVRHAGWNVGIDRQRAAVVLGNAMGGEHAKHLALRVRFREVLALLDEADLSTLEPRIEALLDRQLPPVDVESMAGLLANVVAGRVAAWLDWMGGNLTVDAACAASLAAVSVAVDWLRTGRADAVLTGGVDTDLAPETFVGFCRTDALSSRGSRPFSTEADGFVMGEGAAVFALRRLGDARRSGERIWAVIRGVGQSSDGRGKGITAPRAEGQRLAIERAHAEAGISPSSIGMIEAHGTGTPLGDATELGVLATWHTHTTPAPWIGSVKSNIGHLKAAAGAAGLLKTVLALAAGVIPPTLHAGPVRAEAGRLRLPRTPVRFPPGPRRASVSAFGFGGTNFHLLVEGAGAASSQPTSGHEVAWKDTAAVRVAAYGEDDAVALAQAFADDAPRRPIDVATRNARLVVVGAAEPHRAALADWLASGQPTWRAPGVSAWRGEGVARPIIGLFPGQGSQRVGAWDSAARLPAAADLLARWPDYRAEESQGAEVRRDPLAVHHTLVATELAWTAALAGVPFAAVAGHSLGELAALSAGGRLDPAAAMRLADRRGRALQATPPGAMLAVEASPDRALALAPGLFLAAINGPTSAVVAGPSDRIDQAASQALSEGLAATRLAVDRAFHTPAAAPAAAAILGAGVSSAPGTVEVWSAASASPFPAEVFPLLAEAVTQTVQFAALVAALGARHAQPVWLEIGPGTTLCRRAAAQAGGWAVPLDPDPSDPDALAHAAGALLAAGHAGLLDVIPRTWADVAPPVPVRVRRPVPAAFGAAADPAPQAPLAASSPVHRAAADAVLDLRIAALADPQLELHYQAARRALILQLVGAAEAPVRQVSPPRSVAPPVPVARVAPPTPAPEPALVRSAPPPLAPASALRDAVVAAISEVTGYPPEALNDTSDLEADLGIDSIRKMEVLGLLQQRLAFRATEADYARLARVDLAGLVGYVTDRVSSPQVAARAITPFTVEAQTSLGEAAFAPDAPPLPPVGTFQVGSPAVWRVPLGATPEAVVQQALGLPAADTWVVVHSGDPGGHAAEAFVRSACRERGAAFRTIRIGDVVERRIHAEVHATERPALVQLGRATAAIQAVAFEPEAESLPDRPVVLATGGSSGILAVCLRALAPLRPRIILLGRRPSCALEVEYHVCDATDPAAVAAITSDVRRRYGRIDVVLHAAGVLRDAPLARLSAEDAHAVLAPKVEAARALMAATAEDRPRWLAFGSIVASEGNPGQTVYAAANAALSAMHHPTSNRSTTVAWGPWSDVGMASAPGVAALLASRGIPSLAPEEGARAFLRALSARATTLTAGSPRPPAPLPWPIAVIRAATLEGWTFGLHLDAADAALRDHQVAGRALVPAALWIRAMDLAITLVDAARGPWAIDRFEVQLPTFVEGRRDDVTLELKPAAEGWTARVMAGETPVATSSLRPTSFPPPQAAPQHRQGLPGELLYRADLLFHGPAWQVVQQFGAERGGSAWAELSGGAVDRVAATIDAAHQLAAAWSAACTGWIGLPVGATRWTLAGPMDGALRLELRARAEPGGVIADVIALAADGRVVVRGEGVRLKRAAPAPSDLHWEAG